MGMDDLNIDDSEFLEKNMLGGKQGWDLYENN